MEDFDFYEDDEEAAAAEEEGSNRLFVYALAGLGGLLVVGICAVIVVAVYLAPRWAADQEAQNPWQDQGIASGSLALDPEYSKDSIHQQHQANDATAGDNPV